PEVLAFPGETPEQIFQRTGMWKAPGGKWLSDNASVAVPDDFAVRYFADVKARNKGPVQGYTLEDIIGSNHPLFKQHPFLAGLKMEKMLVAEGLMKPGQNPSDVLTVKLGGKVGPAETKAAPMESSQTTEPPAVPRQGAAPQSVSEPPAKETTTPTEPVK